MLRLPKQDRLALLRLTIATSRLSKQSELIAAMSAQGFDVTQATLSRDLRRLGIVKVATDDGTYAYALPDSPEAHAYRRRRTTPQKTRPALPPAHGFLSIQFTGNMAVVHTRPGFATSIAANIDAAQPQGVIGTIAGDDTIFIALEENALRTDIADALADIIPDMVI